MNILINYPLFQTVIQGGDRSWRPFAGKDTEEIVEARKEYFRQQTQDRNDAIDNDLMKEQHPSMPINSDRQTRVTFGGTKKS